MHRFGKLVGSAAVLLMASATAARAQGSAGETFSGRFSAGIRSVDVSGSQTKYQEDIDLDDGPRLFDLGFEYRPNDSAAKVDLVELEASNLGGDPFENLHLAVRKFGMFDFKLDRHRSRYFYHDTLTPEELASVPGSTGGDFHLFDFERVRDSAGLDIHISPRTEFNLDLEHWTRTGNSTTTLDIERDEFELDKPLEESLGTVGLGLRHAWDKITLIAEERLGNFESEGEIFLPGYSEGSNVDDTAALAYFRFNQPSEYDQRMHTVRILTRPTPRLKFDAGFRRSDFELDMTAEESSAGTSFAGAPFSTALTGFAAVDRTSDVGDLELGYLVSDRIEISLSAHNSTLDQAGYSLLDAAEAQTSWRIESDRLEASIGIAVAASVQITAGFSTDDRDVSQVHDVADPLTAHASGTSRDGYFVELHYNPTGALALTAAVEDNSIDDAYTLSSPTDGRRYRVNVRYRWENGIALSGSYRIYDLENELSGWSGDTEQGEIRLSRQREQLSWTFGLGNIDYSRNIDQLVTGGTRTDLFVIAYAADSDFLDGSVRWQLRPNLALGGQYATYENTGSFPVDRDDFRGFLEVDLDAGYVVQLAYRDVSYDEDVFDDYDAKIIELGVGFRW